MSNAIFYLGLSLLFTHELDAISAREWRLLPMLSRLKDGCGRWWFIAIHVPLFAALMLGAAATEPTRQLVRQAIAVFFIVHLGLHTVLRNHAHYGFPKWPSARADSALSWALISGCALCGAICLAF
jgi:hypothetical protein